jgi:hypothetical protein
MVPSSHLNQQTAFALDIAIITLAFSNLFHYP